MTRPEAVRVWLLGGFRVTVGPRSIEERAWRLKKAAALVKLLALTPGHRLHREQVMDLLWPNLGKKAASNNLRQVVHATRRTFAPTDGSQYLASDGELLVLCPRSDLWVDVKAFKEAAGTARRAKEPMTYRAALDLYGGDLLPEDGYEPWAEGRREELCQLYLALLVELAGLHEGRGEHGPAIEALHKATVKEPSLEEAHAALMRLHALSGRPEQALAQYERLRDALSRSLGTQPGPTTRRLRDEIARGRFTIIQPAALPLEEPPDANKHNLPAPRTSFVGRGQEMIEIKRTLSMTRLLTLTGAGGSGKTRLALEVARSLVGVYPDGVWLVELAPLSEGNLVPPAVASALGVHEHPDRPLTDTLAKALRGKDILLVLDNCEHLVEAAARLVDVLLDTSSKLRILATSRQALGVAGEIRWTVPALSSPDPHAPLSVVELEGYESAQLFVERARQRNTSFALTADNAQALVEVCGKLDGIPLAVELAAARAGSLAVKEIASRLNDSLKLLTDGGRMAVPRQRTLRGTLDWSYKLLSEEEMKLFAQVSVFAGGWTLEAAEAVGAGDIIEEEDILDLLTKLVDKSLVVAEALDQSGMRYGMLEPIQQYAWEKLRESDEAEAVRRRHAAFFLKVAEEAEPELRGPRQREWLACLEREHDNFRAALSWALEQERPELTLRLGSALWRFWARHDHWSEGRRWLKEGLAKCGAVETPVRAKVLSGLGTLVMSVGDFKEAQICFRESLELSQETDDAQGVAESTDGLGWTMMQLGELQRATHLLEDALERYRRLGDKFGAARAIFALGLTSIETGDYEQAQTCYQESLELFREVGDQAYVGLCLCDLGWVVWRRGELESAAIMVEEGLDRLRETGVSADPDSLLDLAHMMLSQDNTVRAKTLLKEGLTLAWRTGNKPGLVRILGGMATIAGTQGESERVARLWGAAEASREDMNLHRSFDLHTLYEPYLDAARTKLGNAAWEVALVKGRAMTLEEAVEYALSEDKSAMPASEQQGFRRMPAALTRREQEIAALVARGLTNRQIASKLHISEHTAATHLRRILKKLELHSRSQIAAWVTEQGSPLLPSLD